MSKPTIRRVKNDLYFVEWGNVRIGGTFSQLATFAADLQAGMTKALAGDSEDKLSINKLASLWRPNYSRGEDDY